MKDDISPYLLACKHTTPAYERRMLEFLEAQNPRLAIQVKAALEKERAQGKGQGGKAKDGQAWGEVGDGYDRD